MSKQVAQEAWIIMLEFIKNRQSELGITTYRLAKEANMPEATVHRILAGQRIPSVVTYLQLLAGLKINPHLVAKEADSMPYPTWPEPDPN